MQTLPQTSRYLKKKRKTLITFVSLIFTTFDRIVIPLSLIPFCPSSPSVRPFRLPRPSRIFVLSTDRPAPLATLRQFRRYSRPFRRRRRITEILKYGILLALLAPPSSIYDAAKLNFLSCRLPGVWVSVVGEWKRYVPGIFRGFLTRRFFRYSCKIIAIVFLTFPYFLLANISCE